MGEERRISFGVKKHVATLEIHGVCGSLSKIIQYVALKLVTLFPFPTYFFTLMSFLIYLAGFSVQYGIFEGTLNMNKGNRQLLFNKSAYYLKKNIIKRKPMIR